MRRDPWRDSFSDFPDLMSRLSRLKLLARLCISGLNPDASGLLERFKSRHSKHFVQTFQTQILGATLQFVSKSGCHASRGLIHVQTFETLGQDFQDSNSRREDAIWV